VRESSPQPDAALVTAARSGDRQAFGVLVRRYQPLVCAIAYSRLEDFDSALDVAQDAFLVSFETLPRLRSADKFAPWLRRITQRLCSRWLRSERYRRALKRELRTHSSSQQPIPPDDLAHAHETSALLKRAMNHLSPALREVLLLHYFHGQSHAETAQILGITYAAVGKRVERAKRAVRQFLTSEIETELRRACPGDDFTKRTLAAIPAGSICARLGLDVTRIGIAEALTELAQSVIQNAPAILTGGLAMTVSKGTLTAAAVVLLALAGTGYLVIRYGRIDTTPAQSGIESPASPAAASSHPSVREVGVQSRSAESAETSSQQLDAQWIVSHVDAWQPGWTARIPHSFLEDPANAFNRFLLAAALMVDRPRFQEAKDLLRSSDFAWLSDPTKLALVRAYLDANSQALATLKAGIGEAKYYKGPPFFSPGGNVLLQHLVHFRALMFMLRGEALLLHQRGQVEPALADSLMGLGMAHHILSGGTVVESMIGCSAHYVAATAFEFILPEVRDPTLCRQAIAELDQLLSLDSYRIHEQVQIKAGSVPPGAAYLLAEAQDKSQEALGILNAALDLPYREFASLPRPADMPVLVPWDTYKASASSMYRDKASMAACKTLAVLKAYQLERGQFPETLEQLVPEYLPEVPIDPFIGEPLKYVRSDEAVTVYAIGFDLKDDGGTKWTGSTFKGKGDYVFHVR